ncbi:MAG: Histidine kinase [Micavibrio sp.]|nr:Histidine kinase [Micavibrio sp.]
MSQSEQHSTLTQATVRITEQLEMRPDREIDLVIENKILHSLADALTSSPRKLLELLVDLACEICDADSAGVSLLEEQEGGATLFRWVAMGGAHKKYLGGLAPREGSSCGECMDLNSAQLYAMPRRFHDHQTAADPVLVEELIVPIPGAESKEPIGSLWIASQSTGRKFDREDVRLLTRLASFTAAALRMQDLLVKEQDARQLADSANDAKTSFLTNMSHEIRTPMNAVIGLSDILSMSSPLTSRQREFVRTLQSSARSLMDLINDILDIAKIEAETFDVEDMPFSLTQVIEEVVSMTSVRANQKQIDFFVAQSAIKDVVFIGDALRIRQILTNLCGNAVKFTEQGSVQVKVAMLNTFEDRSALVEMKVTDSGIGIPEDKLEGIFEKFNQGDTSITRRYGGTGLGLAITKNLVERMGGTITVESEMGRGSTFTVRLPLSLADEEYALLAITPVLGTSLLPAPDQSNWPRVLLVEDYKPNAIVAQVYIEDFGYRCDVASNGVEAAEKALGGDYIAILMDVQMHEMDGYEATAVIRQEEKRRGGKPLYIIGMTAHAMAGDREKCLMAGMNDYIPKPFDPKLLKSKLASLLTQPS